MTPRQPEPLTESSKKWLDAAWQSAGQRIGFSGCINGQTVPVAALNEIVAERDAARERIAAIEARADAAKGLTTSPLIRTEVPALCAALKVACEALWQVSGARHHPLDDERWFSALDACEAALASIERICEGVLR
jgi:hypothetical protein